MFRISSLIAVIFIMVLATLQTTAGEMVIWGPGDLRPNVRAITILPNGDLLIAVAGRLLTFGADGAYKGAQDGPGGQINGIIIDKAGLPIYASNDGGIYRTTANGMQNIGGFGFASPWEVVLDDNGILYATDGGSHVAKAFSPRGFLLRSYLAKGDGVEPMERPYSLALDANQRLYISDERKPGLWVFANDGTFIKRIFADIQCYRLKRSTEGIYVVTDQGTFILDANNGEILRKINTPGGWPTTVGFAVAPDGSLYFGSHYECLVRKYSSEGKLIQIIGPAYKARLTLPEQLTPSKIANVAWKLEQIATGAVALPKVTMVLQPALLTGEPDSNYANAQGSVFDATWWLRRLDIYKSLERKLTVAQTNDELQVTVPADVPTNLYRLLLTIDNGNPVQRVEIEGMVRVIQPDANASLTIYIPRQRTVFQQSEIIEMNAIIRSRATLPASTLRITLAPRKGDELTFQPTAPLWKSFPVPELTNSTLTFNADAGNIHPGRYLLQAELLTGTSRITDVWPLQITSAIPLTRYQILFPEWSGGFTDVEGPFTGKGMRADSARLAQEGITLYDATILTRGSNPPFSPIGPESARTQELMAIANDHALPAPERFLTASPLEIELQEALRNGLSVQRDIWGYQFLENWGYANPMAMARDNRLVRLWTQWQREWPSWVGHRYLTLSIDEGDNPDRMALLAQLKPRGIAPVPEEDLHWARNGMQRRMISDAPYPVESELWAIGAAPDGHVYVVARSGRLLDYDANGKLVKSSPFTSNVRDFVVAPDGTIYAASIEPRVTIYAPDGTTKSWNVATKNYLGGICLAADGTLLITTTEAKIYRYRTDGTRINAFGEAQTIGYPGGIAVLKDGVICVADAGRGGIMLFNEDGTPLKFLAGAGSGAPGGNMDVMALPDDTLWVTNGGNVMHIDRNGKLLGTVGRTTFAFGGFSGASSIALAANGNLLVADCAQPYAQELTQSGTPVRQFGLNTFLADVRVDRQRYVWNERIVSSVWMPVPGQTGDAKATLQAFARQGDNPWQPLPVTVFTGGDFTISVPKFTGETTLRLIWAPAGAAAEHPFHADFPIIVYEKQPDADTKRSLEILQRELAWKEAWSRARMGGLVRWTEISDQIRPGTLNTAPTQFGTPDTLAEGVWVPYRRNAVGVEAENDGHDFGTFPMQGPWYVARALEGPEAKPVWISLLQWFWNDAQSLRRPLRDWVLFLGAGASGIGEGMLVSRMPEQQLAAHRKIAGHLQQLGDAALNLELPGKGGVAILHSFTQEAMDPYNEEQFYAGHAAWYDLARLHVPVAAISEESIARDGLIGNYTAVLLPNIHFPLSPETMAGLERFRKAGGEIWGDLGTRITVPGMQLLSTRYRPFIIQDEYYRIATLRPGAGMRDGNYEFWRMRQGSNQRLPAVRAAFSKYAHMPMNTNDPDIFLLQRKGGEATYVFACNDHLPDTPLYQSHLTSDAPAPTSATFTLSGGAIYDALALQPVTGKELKVDFTDAEPSRIWAVFPRAIAGVKTTALMNKNKLVVSAKIIDKQGIAIPAVSPLEITVTDAGGQLQYHLWRGTDASGTCLISLPVNWPIPAGNWQVTVRDLLAGTKGTVTVAITTQPPAALTLDTSTTLAFDKQHISAWLLKMKGQEVWIPLDSNQQALQPDAEIMAASLQKLGIKARTINIAEMKELDLNMNNNPNTDTQQALEQIRDGKAIGMRRRENPDFREPGPLRVIMRHLILLGDPAQNRWLADIHNYQLVRRPLSPSYPGVGRALLQYAWTPFYDGYDAVTISANDISGLRAGIAKLLELGK